jgi:hypothetical protein
MWGFKSPLAHHHDDDHHHGVLTFDSSPAFGGRVSGGS